MYRTYHASYAVDGNRGYPGMITNAGSDNWWAVDLGRMTYVGNVTISPHVAYRKYAKLVNVDVTLMPNCVLNH